jgi:uncharacterized protein (DUF111 family)
LTRRTQQIDTPYGLVTQKISEGYGTEHRKLEYEDLAKIAREQDIPLLDLQTV